ncbi:MAG TPA: hypothetical protein VGF14_00985 [Alphaproteobacteria bacterium]
MQRSILKIASLTLGLLLTGQPASRAQTVEEAPPAVTIPLEVAMIYHKLLNTPPNFEQLVLYSPKLENAPEFGRQALIAQEKVNLERVYNQTKRDTLLVIREPMAIKAISMDAEQIELKRLDGDTPFTYNVGKTTYGVFLRNAGSMVLPIKSPYVQMVNWSTLAQLARVQKMVIVEMKLKPMGADDQNFTTFSDDIVKPILADVIDLRIYHPQMTESLLLHKRDEKAWSNTSNLEDLVEDDLKDDTLPINQIMPGELPQKKTMQ